MRAGSIQAISIHMALKKWPKPKDCGSQYAMVHLLTSLEIGAMDDRLVALRSLRDEVLDTAEGPMPKNTARVLMQIIKEVVRTRDNYRLQLELGSRFSYNSFRQTQSCP